MSPDASWTFSPGAIALLALVTGWYVVRWRAAGERPVRLVLFLAGIATIAAALLSPIDALGEQLFLMHMVQHLLLLDIAAILLILGLTKRILRPVTRRLLPVERSAGFLATPVFAITLYVATMWVWHIPALYDLALENAVVHVVEHLSFAIAGGLYWWHIFSPIRPRHQMLGLGPAGYMISTKVLVGLLGVFLTFSPDSFYAFYEDQPRYWGLSPGDDQAIGGAIMALEQMIVMGAAFGWLFVRMLGESEREEQRAERFGGLRGGGPAGEAALVVPATPDPATGRASLNGAGARAELRRRGVTLHEGLVLLVRDEAAGTDHEARATWDAEWGGWFAERLEAPAPEPEPARRA